MIYIGKFDRKLTDRNTSIISFVIPNYYANTELEPNKDYKIEITEVKSKRSLFQNKMMWQLIHDIARVQGMTDDDVYCQVVELANIRAEYMQVLPVTVEHLRKVMRVVKEVEMRKSMNGADMVVVKCYYGTSTFDVAEMSEFIDRLLDYASEVGIDTRQIREDYR